MKFSQNDIDGMIDQLHEQELRSENRGHQEAAKILKIVLPMIIELSNKYELDDAEQGAEFCRAVHNVNVSTMIMAISLLSRYMGHPPKAVVRTLSQQYADALDKGAVGIAEIIDAMEVEGGEED